MTDTKAETKAETKAPAFTPKIKKLITLPLIKPQIDVPIYVHIVEKMFVGKDIKQSIGGKKMEPATLCNCVNMETGEVAQIIIPAVLHGIFDDEYPEDSYVGCAFMITKHSKIKDKNYHPFSVAEIESNVE